jgi:hypothetical protein
VIDDELRELAEERLWDCQQDRCVTDEHHLARAVLRLLEERDLWKERAETWQEQDETWQEQEMMNPGEWKLRQAIVEAARAWANAALGTREAQVDDLLYAVDALEDAEARDRRIDSPDSPPAESKP